MSVGRSLRNPAMPGPPKAATVAAAAQRTTQLDQVWPNSEPKAYTRIDAPPRAVPHPSFRLHVCGVQLQCTRAHACDALCQTERELAFRGAGEELEISITDGANDQSKYMRACAYMCTCTN